MVKMGYAPEKDSWKRLSSVIEQRLDFWANPDNNITIMNEEVSPFAIITMRDFLQSEDPTMLYDLVNYKDPKNRPLGKILIKGDFPEDYAGFRDKVGNEKLEDWVSCSEA